jgi:hypothetical protein
MDFKERKLGYELVHLPQNRNQQWALVGIVMYLDWLSNCLHLRKDHAPWNL